LADVVNEWGDGADGAIGGPALQPLVEGKHFAPIISWAPWGGV
jgi:hypothetical protein